MKAWHFLCEDRRTQHTGELVEAGTVLRASAKPLRLCAYGLHASEKALDALHFAPGPVVCRVELSGDILRGTDKVCASERKVLSVDTADPVLHEFACWCAERALTQVVHPDPRSVDAIAAKRVGVRGEAMEAAVRAAREASTAAAVRWDPNKWETVLGRRAAITALMAVQFQSAVDCARMAAKAWAPTRWGDWLEVHKQNEELERCFCELLGQNTQ